MAETYNERVIFRMLHMPCCGAQICWVNPRLPNHCPECGVLALGELRAHPERIMINDPNAWLLFHA